MRNNLYLHVYSQRYSVIKKKNSVGGTNNVLLWAVVKIELAGESTGIEGRYFTVYFMVFNYVLILPTQN